MSRGYYPKGQDIELIQYHEFFQISYYKNTVADGNKRAIAYFANQNELDAVIKKMKATNVSIIGVFKWNIPHGEDFKQVMLSLKKQENFRTEITQNYA